MVFTTVATVPIAGTFEGCASINFLLCPPEAVGPTAHAWFYLNEWTWLVEVLVQRIPFIPRNECSPFVKRIASPELETLRKISLCPIYHHS